MVRDSTTNSSAPQTGVSKLLKVCGLHIHGFMDVEKFGYHGDAGLYDGLVGPLDRAAFRWVEANSVSHRIRRR